MGQAQRMLPWYGWCTANGLVIALTLRAEATAAGASVLRRRNTQHHGRFFGGGILRRRRAPDPPPLDRAVLFLVALPVTWLYCKLQ